MPSLALLLRQVRYENRAFWRNPAAAFFTFVFPLMFLVIFNLVFGNDTIRVEGGTTRASNFFIPAITAFGVISACYTNIAMSVAIVRDRGQLKRVRGTPLPPWIYLGGRVLHATFIALLLVIIVTVAGVLFYDVDPPTNTAPAFIVTLVVGAAAFTALGLAMTGFIPNADAAPAVVNASVLPLLFISDVFIRMEDPPVWLSRFADLFPVKHFSLALQTSFNPFEQGPGFEWSHLAVIVLWGVLGALLAVRYFTWEPRR
jgi:ABC-2 type transport system permease protein